MGGRRVEVTVEGRDAEEADMRCSFPLVAATDAGIMLAMVADRMGREWDMFNVV
jgi:hypothetical protein